MTNQATSQDKIIKRLNEGGTSVHCKSEDVNPHLRLAPKLPPTGFGKDRVEEPGFLKEPKSAAGATVNNPSITGVIGFPSAYSLLSKCGQL